MDFAVEMEGIRKTFGPKVAVAGMDLRVARGALYGFIGPNGAGKTTTIRMIMSIIFPDSGRMSVLGRASAVESKDRIGYLPEERGVYKKMRVGAFLRHMARLKSVPPRDVEPRVRTWLDRVGLADCYRKRCDELSKGMQQKVQFIAAVLHEPELIILDEPFSGLDPVNMRLLRDLFLEQHAAGRTVIFSTHVMHQAETLCDHLIMINQGRKVLDGTMDEIRARYDTRTIAFEPVRGEDAKLASGLAGVRSVANVNGAFEASLADGADAPEVMRRIVQAMPVGRIEIRRPSLEDIFIDIARETGGEEREGEGGGETRTIRGAFGERAGKEHA